MNEVLNKINILYEQLQTKDKELTRLLGNAKEIKEKQELIQKAQDNRQQDLNDREFKIGKVESLLALKEEANRLLKEAQEISEKVKSERQIFEEWSEKERADIAQCRKGADSCLEAIKKREADLAYDKKHYKEFIIREIGKVSNNANT